MISRLRTWYARWYNPGRELSRIGHEKRRNDVKATARKIRIELGLPPLEALK